MAIKLHLYLCENCPRNSECTESLQEIVLEDIPGTFDAALHCKYEGQFDYLGNSLVPIEKRELRVVVPVAYLEGSFFQRANIRVVTLAQYLDNLGFIRVSQEPKKESKWKLDPRVREGLASIAVNILRENVKGEGIKPNKVILDDIL